MSAHWRYLVFQNMKVRQTDVPQNKWKGLKNIGFSHYQLCPALPDDSCSRSAQATHTWKWTSSLVKYSQEIQTSVLSQQEIQCQRSALACAIQPLNTVQNTSVSFISAVPQPAHISQHSSNYGGQTALQREEENLTDLHSCHEWSSDHLQSHQRHVLSYLKSLLSYHSYTLGILMMALLFAVISGNSMTYLPGSWAKWTRQASLKIMIMETGDKIGIVLNSGARSTSYYPSTWQPPIFKGVIKIHNRLHPLLLLCTQKKKRL